MKGIGKEMVERKERRRFALGGRIVKASQGSYHHLLIQEIINQHLKVRPKRDFVTGAECPIFIA